MKRSVAQAVWIAVVAALIMNAPAPLVAEQKVLRETFQETSFKEWQLMASGSFAANHCRVGPPGLRCMLPAGGAVPACGAESKFTVRGDFTIIVRYQLLELPTPDRGRGTGVKIAIEDKAGTRNSIQRINLPSGEKVFSAYRGAKQPDGTLEHSDKTRPTQANYGQLRLQRVGETLTWSAAEERSGVFVDVRTEPCSNDDVTKLSLLTQSAGATTDVEAILTDVEVIADDLFMPAPVKIRGPLAAAAASGPAPEPPKTTSQPLIWTTIGTFIALCCVIAFLVWESRRRKRV